MTVCLYACNYIRIYITHNYIFNCTGTFILQNCSVTSPSIGTIRVSCDSPHQILISTCTNNCYNVKMISNGSSPLTVRGLDPGIMYSVVFNVFDGNQVVVQDEIVTKTITVMGDKLSKISM